MVVRHLLAELQEAAKLVPELRQRPQQDGLRRGLLHTPIHNYIVSRCNSRKRETHAIDAARTVLLRQLGFGEFHLLALRRVQVGAEAGAATGFVDSGRANDDQLAAGAQALRMDGRRAAHHAHRG